MFRRKRCRLATDEVWESTLQASQEYGHPITSVLSFNYLGRFLIYLYNDCTLVVVNLLKVQKKWACMLWILRREGANVQGLGTLFKAVYKGVLIFGSNMWLMTPRMGRDAISWTQRILVSFCLNPPKLPGNMTFQPISPLLATQL